MVQSTLQLQFQIRGVYARCVPSQKAVHSSYSPKDLIVRKQHSDLPRASRASFS